MEEGSRGLHGTHGGRCVSTPWGERATLLERLLIRRSMRVVIGQDGEMLGFFGGRDRAYNSSMRATTSRLLHGESTDRIRAVFYEVHHEFGNGFLERLCQRALIIALREAGLTVQEDRKFD